MRLYLKLLLIGISVSSCLPPRPHVDFCRIKWEVPQGCHCTDGDKRNYDLTPIECGNHLAFAPRDIEAAQNYMIQLEKTVLELQKK